MHNFFLYEYLKWQAVSNDVFFLPRHILFVLKMMTTTLALWLSSLVIPHFNEWSNIVLQTVNSIESIAVCHMKCWFLFFLFSMYLSFNYPYFANWLSKYPPTHLSSFFASQVFQMCIKYDTRLIFIFFTLAHSNSLSLSLPLTRFHGDRVSSFKFHCIFFFFFFG